MKTKRMSLYIISVILLVIMILGSLSVAAWALLSTKLDVSGNIGFTGTGDVLATISKGECTGGTVTQKDGKTPMQQVNITLDGPSDSSSWAGLNLAFEGSSKELEISFSITNNQTEKNLQIDVNESVKTGDVDAIKLDINTIEYGAVKPLIIAPNTKATYRVIFTVNETNTTLSRGFGLDFNFVNTDAAASEPLPEPTLDKLNFTLNEDNKSYTVSGRGAGYSSGSVVIPEKYDDPEDEYGPLPVTGIASSAFLFYDSTTSVYIPSSVKNIGSSAFSETGLESVTISEGVISIGSSAFDECYSLTSIEIPASVTSIGSSAFSECPALESMKVASGNTVYHSADSNCIIETATNTLIAGCKNSVIPTDGSVTSIGNGAFYGCSGLTSITIPASVTKIGSRSFLYCSNNLYTTLNNGKYLKIDGGTDLALVDTANETLTSFAIDSKTKIISDDAFSNCNKLTSITIPASVTNIGTGAFSNCSSLNSMAVASGNTNYRNSGNCIIETATNTLIAGCKSSTISSNVTSIADSAFYGCSGLTSINIPESVTSIGRSAFYGCSGLTSINIPESVTSIGNWVFSNCSKLTSITIPSGVTDIADYAFSGCKSLTSITIPFGVTNIGDDAFSSCSQLTSITFEKTEGNIDIGYNTFNATLTNINFSGKTWTSGGTTYTETSSGLSTKISNASQLNSSSRGVKTWTIS